MGRNPFDKAISRHATLTGADASRTRTGAVSSRSVAARRPSGDRCADLPAPARVVCTRANALNMAVSSGGSHAAAQAEALQPVGSDTVVAARPATRKLTQPIPGPLTTKQKVLKVLEPICLMVPPASMLPMAYFHIPSFGPISAVIVILAMLPFFLDFEAANLRARDLMPIVVMAALGVAGRLIFAPIPAIKPVTAIVIVTAMSFGRQTGFITGALIALVSNIFFGQGPWTPWQMYTWGLVGYLSGIFFNKGWIKNNWFILVYGFAASYFYGAILDTWTFIGFVQPWTLATAAATYGAGAIYNLGHAVGTVIFLIPIAKTWPIKFERVKRKYSIGGWTRETTNAAPVALQEPRR